MKRAIVLSVLVAGIMLAGCNKPNQTPETNTQALVPPGTEVAPAGGMTPANVPPPSGTVTPLPPMGADLTPGAGVYTPAPAGGQGIHEVLPGETLWKIMPQYYGRASKAMEAKIVAANPGMDPAKLKVGQKIVMPAQ